MRARRCVWGSGVGEEVEQARALAHFHMNQNLGSGSLVPVCNGFERQGPGTAGGKSALSKREGDGGGSRQQGLGRGSSCHRG